jgi:hypothetical protein
VNDLPRGHVYDMGPNMDRWVGWSTVEDVARAGRESMMREDDWPSYIEPIVEHAKEQFRERTGWEGDVREGPFVSGLMPPEPGDEFVVAVALKQDNNGWIYVWSPYQLPWLHEHER